MGFRAWRNRRRERKEQRDRLDTLTEDEVGELNATEKEAYMEIAKKQVTFRGKINAYKDFPVPDSENYEIDVDNLEEENLEENEGEVPEELPEVDDEIHNVEVDDEQQEAEYEPEQIPRAPPAIRASRPVRGLQ